MTCTQHFEYISKKLSYITHCLNKIPKNQYKSENILLLWQQLVLSISAYGIIILSFLSESTKNTWKKLNYKFLKATLRLKRTYSNDLLKCIIPDSFFSKWSECNLKVAKYKWESFQRNEQPNPKIIEEIKDLLRDNLGAIEKAKRMPFNIISSGTFVGSYSKYMCKQHPDENLNGDHLISKHRIPEENFNGDFKSMIISMMQEENEEKIKKNEEKIKKYMELQECLSELPK